MRFFFSPLQNSGAFLVAFGSALYLLLLGYPQEQNLSEVDNPRHLLELQTDQTVAYKQFQTAWKHFSLSYQWKFSFKINSMASDPLKHFLIASCWNLQLFISHRYAENPQYWRNMYCWVFGILRISLTGLQCWVSLGRECWIPGLPSLLFLHISL